MSNSVAGTFVQPEPQPPGFPQSTIKRKVVSPTLTMSQPEQATSPQPSISTSPPPAYDMHAQENARPMRPKSFAKGFDEPIGLSQANFTNNFQPNTMHPQTTQNVHVLQTQGQAIIQPPQSPPPAQQQGFQHFTQPSMQQNGQILQPLMMMPNQNQALLQQSPQMPIFTSPHYPNNPSTLQNQYVPSSQLGQIPTAPLASPHPAHSNPQAHRSYSVPNIHMHQPTVQHPEKTATPLQVPPQENNIPAHGWEIPFQPNSTNPSNPIIPSAQTNGLNYGGTIQYVQVPDPQQPGQMQYMPVLVQTTSAPAQVGMMVNGKTKGQLSRLNPMPMMKQLYHHDKFRKVAAVSGLIGNEIVALTTGVNMVKDTTGIMNANNTRQARKAQQKAIKQHAEQQSTQELLAMQTNQAGLQPQQNQQVQQQQTQQQQTQQQQIQQQQQHQANQPQLNQQQLYQQQLYQQQLYRQQLAQQIFAQQQVGQHQQGLNLLDQQHPGQQLLGQNQLGQQQPSQQVLSQQQLLPQHLPQQIHGQSTQPQQFNIQQHPGNSIQGLQVQFSPQQTLQSGAPLVTTQAQQGMIHAPLPGMQPQSPPMTQNFHEQQKFGHQDPVQGTIQINRPSFPVVSQSPPISGPDGIGVTINNAPQASVQQPSGTISGQNSQHLPITPPSISQPIVPQFTVQNFATVDSGHVHQPPVAAPSIAQNFSNQGAFPYSQPGQVFPRQHANQQDPYSQLAQQQMLLQRNAMIQQYLSMAQSMGNMIPRQQALPNEHPTTSPETSASDFSSTQENTRENATGDQSALSSENAASACPPQQADGSLDSNQPEDSLIGCDNDTNSLANSLANLSVENPPNASDGAAAPNQGVVANPPSDTGIVIEDSTTISSTGFGQNAQPDTTSEILTQNLADSSPDQSRDITTPDASQDATVQSQAVLQTPIMEYEDTNGMQAQELGNSMNQMTSVTQNDYATYPTVDPSTLLNQAMQYAVSQNASTMLYPNGILDPSTQFTGGAGQYTDSSFQDPNTYLQSAGMSAQYTDPTQQYTNVMQPYVDPSQLYGQPIFQYQDPTNQPQAQMYGSSYQAQDLSDQLPLDQGQLSNTSMQSPDQSCDIGTQDQVQEEEQNEMMLQVAGAATLSDISAADITV